MYTITANNEDGREVTCALLSHRSRAKNDRNRSVAASTFQDVDTGDLYQYDAEDKVFVKPKRVTLLGDCDKPDYLSLV